MMTSHASQELQDMLLNLHEFALEGQNMKFAVNMLLYSPREMM